MNTWIALLKSINVGGNNVLPMAELRSLAASVGFENISTYIQSGNCIFQSDEPDAKTLAERLGNAVFKAKGFHPPILVLSREELEQMIAACPFTAEPENHSKIHFIFHWVMTWRCHGMRLKKEQRPQSK